MFLGGSSERDFQQITKVFKKVHMLKKVPLQHLKRNQMSIKKQLFSGFSIKSKLEKYLQVNQCWPNKKV